jgi:hypothetical protein
MPRSLGRHSALSGDAGFPIRFDSLAAPVVELWQLSREAVMAKGQMKGNKEAKKPKGDKSKSGGSA